jgi:hypothetical protein
LNQSENSNKLTKSSKYFSIITLSVNAFHSPIRLTDLIFKIQLLPRCQWLTPIIPTTQEADIRRITVLGQPRQIVHQILSRKNPLQNEQMEWLKVLALSSSPSTTHTKRSNCLLSSEKYTSLAKTHMDYK